MEPTPERPRITAVSSPASYLRAGERLMLTLREHALTVESAGWVKRMLDDPNWLAAEGRAMVTADRELVERLLQ